MQQNRVSFHSYLSEFLFFCRFKVKLESQLAAAQEANSIAALKMADAEQTIASLTREKESLRLTMESQLQQLENENDELRRQVRFYLCLRIHYT